MEVDETTSEEGSRCSSRASNIAGRGSSLGRTSPVVLNKPLGGGGKSFGEFAVPNPPSHSSHPSKLMLSARRSSSGIFLSNMFSSRFRHLQKLHSDAFLLGLNAVSYPGLPTGTMFRSSLPATPVSTPIHREPFHQFTEQALKERLCKTPSPRKNRGFYPHSSHPSNQQSHQHQTGETIEMNDNDSACSDQHQPMDTTSPIPPPSLMDDALAETSESSGPSHREARNNQDKPKESSSSSSQQDNVKKLFVKNIGYNLEAAQKALQASPEELTVNLTELLGCNILNPIRILQVFPAQEKLMSRVREDVKTTKEAKEEVLKEREGLVEKIIAGEIKRAVIQEEEPSEVPIQRLTDDLLSLVFSRLYDLKDCARCERVCKRWNRVMKEACSIRHTLVLASTFYSLDSPVLTKKILFDVLKKFPGLKRLDLDSVSDQLDEVAFQIIGECCPALETLIFRKANLTGTSLKYLAECCQNLKEIDLTDCNNLTEKNLWGFLKIAKSLEILNLFGNARITGKCFYQLERVKEIDLTWCKKLNCDAFSKLAQKSGDSLTKLKVGPITADALAFICSNFKNITTLEIECFEGKSIGMKEVSKLRNLECFIFRCSMDDLNDRTFIELLKKCPELRKLHLSAAANSLTDASVSMIPSYGSKIVSLELPYAAINDQSFFAIATLDQLERLVVKSTNVTDKGILAILENCHSLAYLDVDLCQGVSCESLNRAYDLIQEKKLNKELLICYNYKRVKVGNVSQKELLIEYETGGDFYFDYDSDEIEDDDDDVMLHDSDFNEEEEMT